ncbi:pilus assembly protein TadG-related protein [Novosphingobium album (ex Hu et al. 2023)]|uniref:Pilus assembly protein TadG-related protein n=1 Tax=Novosphingobium album (ex Hu et al. 2023) TaxID=2930093 RepID=A0ABT0B0V7_9SPHN|nr:pilus assembly protein TadG-related protein [Novosphingobium album (ex Hu et al. 2023)]MCJ2178716.1 pilus assembly protein TadG-related protein [Novosphingobium album (ex Hu et al. 2023)]
MNVFPALATFVNRFARCTSGATATMVALMLIPILGATALAVDAGYWFYKQRDMQSAADSAALAGARTPDEASDPNDDFINVARGTAAKYGYVNGEGSVTVDVSRVTCPSADPTAAPGCTQVVIGYDSPLFFSPIVGFAGNKSGKQGVAAMAVAGDQAGDAPEFCIVTLGQDLGSKVNGLEANGVPDADLNGCDIFSNDNATCNGHNLNAGTVYTVAVDGKDNSGCGTDHVYDVDPFEDPYAELADNIPADTCTGYAQAAKSGGKLSIGNTANTLSNAATLSGTVKICGDVLLTGNVTLNDVNLVIYNGRLITQNYTFKANSSTVVFSGSPTDSKYYHFPTDTVPTPSNTSNGILDITAPTSDANPWHGVAVYQDPALKTNVDIAQAGNSPAFNITGLFYAPNSNIDLRGIVNKLGTGYKCFVLVAYTVQVSGTGDIFKDGALDECDAAGLETPTVGVASHKWLVQ